MSRRITRRDFLEAFSAMGLALPVFDVKHPRGFDFTHVNSPTAQKYLIETMGGGVALFDYNNDGLLDIFLVNSGTLANPMHAPETFDRQNPRNWNRLYRQNADGSFTDVTKEAGLANAGDGNYGMGVAVGDYDNDGDIDVLVLNMNDPPSLLRNDGGNKNNWIKIKLIGTHCNRTAIGARVRVAVGSHVQMDEVHSGGSVMSQSDLRLHFGVGDAKKIDLLEVKWPTTWKIEKFADVEVNRFLTIKEGVGITKKTAPQT